MSKFYKLYPSDTMDDFSVFRKFDSNGKLVLRTSYQDMACVKCGKIDELAALSRCVPDAPILNAKLDVLETFDHILIVSIHAKLVLDNLCPTDFVFHPFPSTEMFYIAMPCNLIHPINSDAAFCFTDKCRECGRYSEVVWGPDVLQLNANKQVAAYLLESRLGIMPSWIVSQKIAIAIKGQKPKLKGFIFNPV